MRVNSRWPMDGPLPISLLAGAVYGPVSLEETAFAMTLFVGAASGQAGTLRCGDGRRRSGDCECVRVLRALVSAQADLVRPAVSSGRGEGTLEDAFAAVWHQYDKTPDQLSVSARVLGFHFLAQKHGGRILERWVLEDAAKPEVVTLDPALVEALATMPLGENGSLDKGLLFATAELLA